MAFDMKIFEDLLGDQMNDEYRSLLGNISGGTGPQIDPNANYSQFGFDPNRHHGVKSLGETMDERNRGWEQSQARSIMESEKKSQAYAQKEQARLAREAAMQSAANLQMHQGNQRAQQLHAQESMNRYNSALQQEQLRQKRAGTPTRNPYADNFGLKEAFGALTNPTGFMAKTLMGAASGGAKKQPSAQQRQQMMQQMLRGSFGK